jgi:DNA-binding response OmpR family regulator
MPKILVIEDDVDMAEAIRMPLEANGYEVVHALTGEEGLQKVKRVEDRSMPPTKISRS